MLNRWRNRVQEIEDPEIAKNRKKNERLLFEKKKSRWTMGGILGGASFGTVAVVVIGYLTSWLFPPLALALSIILPIIFLGLGGLAGRGIAKHSAKAQSKNLIYEYDIIPKSTDNSVSSNVIKFECHNEKCNLFFISVDDKKIDNTEELISEAILKKARNTKTPILIRITDHNENKNKWMVYGNTIKSVIDNNSSVRHFDGEWKWGYTELNDIDFNIFFDFYYNEKIFQKEFGSRIYSQNQNPKLKEISFDDCEPAFINRVKELLKKGHVYKNGFEYQKITGMGSEIIPWEKFSPDFPRDDKEIVRNKIEILPKLLLVLYKENAIIPSPELLEVLFGEDEDSEDDDEEDAEEIEEKGNVNANQDTRKTENTIDTAETKKHGTEKRIFDTTATVNITLNKEQQKFSSMIGQQNSSVHDQQKEDNSNLPDSSRNKKKKSVTPTSIFKSFIPSILNSQSLVKNQVFNDIF